MALVGLAPAGLLKLLGGSSIPLIHPVCRLTSLSSLGLWPCRSFVCWIFDFWYRAGCIFRFDFDRICLNNGPSWWPALRPRAAARGPNEAERTKFKKFWKHLKFLLFFNFLWNSWFERHESVSWVVSNLLHSLSEGYGFLGLFSEHSSLFFQGRFGVSVVCSLPGFLAI